MWLGVRGQLRVSCRGLKAGVGTQTLTKRGGSVCAKEVSLCLQAREGRQTNLMGKSWKVREERRRVEEAELLEAFLLCLARAGFLMGLPCKRTAQDNTQ